MTPDASGPEAAAQRLPLGTQLARFVATGALAALVDFGLLLVGQYLFGLGHTAAKAGSWVFGTITAYAINRRWTFGSAGGGGRFAAVVVLYLLTFALQVGTYSVLFPPLRAAFGDAVASTAGFVVAQGLATTVNFVVQRALIFRR